MVMKTNDDICEACGVLAEVGTIIKDGDDVVVIPVEGDNEADARARQERYIEIGKQACADVQVNSELQQAAEGVVLNTTLKFVITSYSIHYTKLYDLC